MDWEQPGYQELRGEGLSHKATIKLLNSEDQMKEYKWSKLKKFKKSQDKEKGR